MTAPARAGLTPRMRDCLDAIIAHLATHRASPSLEELRKALGLASKGRVVEIIRALQERGWITFEPFRTRTIAVVAPSYTLPPKVEAALQAHCVARGEDASSVVADAVALLLDDIDGAEVEA